MAATRLLACLTLMLSAACGGEYAPRTGDLLFTGTPAGVGPVARGDVLRATLEGEELLNFEIR